MPVLVIPLFTTIIAGLLMIVVLGKPIAWLMDQLNDGLNSMSGSSAILLGVVLGLMMAFDMGGPLNKVAYSFAAAGVGGRRARPATHPQLKIMAAVMLAGMVPPIALALATVRPPEPVHRPPSARTARPAGCSARRSSPRARSRSPPPTRCG